MHLEELVEGGSVSRPKKTRQLHRDRRGPRGHPPLAEVLNRGPAESEAVHAAVAVETLVLRGNERLDQSLGYPVDRDRLPRHVAAREDRADHAAVTVAEAHEASASPLQILGVDGHDERRDPPQERDSADDRQSDPQPSPSRHSRIARRFRA